MRQILTCLLLLINCTVGVVHAGEQARVLKVGVFEIATLLSQDTSQPGTYNFVLNEFSGLETYFATPARVDLLFAQQKVDCLFPASTATMTNSQEFLVSKPISRTSAYIFSIEPYQSLEEFEGKVLAIRRGLSVGNIRTRFNADFANINSDGAMIQFLHKRRADGMISYLADSKAAYKSLGLPIDYYKADTPIHTSEEAFVCHKNEFTKAKIAAFNRTIDKLKSSGKLDKILSNTL